MSNISDLRKKMLQKASERSGPRNPLDFVPPVGKTTVRLLPPPQWGEPGFEHFYMTHSYHYLPINGGRYLYTRREYNVDGKRMEDPIDVAVRQWYKLAEKTKDATVKDLASQLKRKRHYFFHCLLVDEEDVEKKYRVLIDRSNDGKLARLICTLQGFPFFKDIQSNWVDKDSLDIDEEKDYANLLDFEEGHDLRIVLTKVEGGQPWDISYSDSFVLKKARGLSEVEQGLLESRVDLASYISYEEDYFAVKKALDEVIDTHFKSSDDIDDEEDSTAPSGKAPALAKDVKDEMKSVASKSKPEEIDDMLDELDDDQ